MDEKLEKERKEALNTLGLIDAASEGNYAEFLKHYTGDPNFIPKYYPGSSMLFYAATGATNPGDRIKIVRFLISEGADVNFAERRRGLTALHVLYFNVPKPPVDYLMEMTKLLVEAGADVNAKNKDGSIPLHHLLGKNRLPTGEIKEVIWYLLEKGSDYNHKNEFGYSCADYGEKAISPIRKDFPDIIKEFENGNKQ